MKKEASARGPVVTGEIVFGEEAESFPRANVYVRLEDTSAADAAAPVVAEQTFRDFAYGGPGDDRLAFRLRAKSLDPRASYNVRVHVDVDADGEVSVGDYITMESYPVLTHGHPDHVSVRVQKVT